MQSAVTAREMVPAIGASVSVRFESVRIECRVNDVKYVWGRIRLQVSPLAGSGEQWVELDRLVVKDGTLAVGRA